jgi:hypothetical protein
MIQTTAGAGIFNNISILFFFFWWDWGLNSGPHGNKAGTGKESTLLLEPDLQSIFALLILERGS